MSNWSNLSGESGTTVVIYRDNFESAVAKIVMVVALALVISYINGTLVHTYRQHQIFYTNPRYILFIHLVLNDTLLLFSSALLFVLTYFPGKFLCWLCLLILSLSVLASQATPLTLAVMAVECYIAVCFPLRHAQLCTIRHTYILIGLIWFLCLLVILPDISILVATKPPEFFLTSLFCDRTAVFGHPVIVLKRDIQYNTYLSGVWFVLIYTYCHIFYAARAAKSSDVKSKKAQNTILLHGVQLFLCTLSYVDHLVVRFLAFWFLRYIIHIAFVIYVLVMILPRLISPILYGLRDRAFRQHLSQHTRFTVIIKALRHERRGEESHPRTKVVAPNTVSIK